MSDRPGFSDCNLYEGITKGHYILGHDVIDAARVPLCAFVHENKIQINFLFLINSQNLWMLEEKEIVQALESNLDANQRYNHHLKKV